MDAIAAQSGVSKATIYKHWKDKEALLLEVLADLHGLNVRPLFDSGDTRKDVIAVLSFKPETRGELRERMTPHLMAYAGRNPAFGDAWRHMVMEPPRRELRHLLKRGIAKKELNPRLDIELSLALLLGPIMYWYIFLRRVEADPKRLVSGVVGAFWLAYGLEPERDPGVIEKSNSRPKATH
jgi:AcrR family transcriptional regulator